MFVLYTYIYILIYLHKDCDHDGDGDDGTEADSTLISQVPNAQTPLYIRRLVCYRVQRSILGNTLNPQPLNP